MKQRRAGLVVTIVAFVTLVLCGTLQRPLYWPDEGRYAEIGREMLHSGNWLVPHLSGVPYADKPPLLYWLEAAGLAVWGDSEFGARFATGAIGLLGVLLTYLLARRMFDAEVALAAAAILGSSVLWIGVSILLLTDGILAVCLLGAFSALWRVWTGRGGAWPVWLCLGLATLAKGPVGPALFALAVAPMWLLDRSRPRLATLFSPVGLALFALVVLPWYLAIERALPGFLNYFLLDQNLRGLVSGEVHHAKPWYYSLGMIAVGFLPWSLLAPQVVRAFWRRPASVDPGRRAELLLASWAAATLAVFTVSASKLMTYYLPMYPALAILVARALVVSRGHALRPMLFLLAGLVAPVVGWVALCQRAGLGPASWPSAGIGIVAAGWVAAAVLLWDRRVAQACCTYLVLLAAGLSVASLDRSFLDRERSVRDLLERSRAHIASCETLVSASFPIGMPEFYLGREVVHLGSPRELSIGRALAPDQGRFVERSEIGSLLDRSTCILAKGSVARRLVAEHPELDMVTSEGKFALLVASGRES